MGETKQDYKLTDSIYNQARNDKTNLEFTDGIVHCGDKPSAIQTDAEYYQEQRYTAIFMVAPRRPKQHSATW